MVKTDIFKRKKKTASGDYINVGQVSEADLSNGILTPYRTKNTKLLEKLRYTYNSYDAINLLIDEHPDVSMAFSVLQALVNQGGRIEFSDSKGKNSSDILAEWEDFAARVNSTAANGLDGLMVQLHGNDFRSGGMGCEVVVKEDLSDIEEIYPISGSCLEWKLEERGGKHKWIPYQLVNGKQIDLSEANFLWIPFNPKDNPEGTLLFAPAIPAADMQLEFFNSSQSVLYRVGCPRYDVKINKERLLASAPADVKNNIEKQKQYIQSAIAITMANFKNISVKNDIIHTDDTDVGTIGGESSAFFQGIGAYANIIDVQIMNAVKVLKTLMNRSASGSYALSTVEFKVIVDMLEPRQRAEKRMVENIARIWLRVHGYNATAKYTPNPIEWQSMLDKIDFELKNQQFYRRSDEYGYISPDEAAQKVNNARKAFTNREGFFEYISRLLQKGDNSE